VLLKDEISALPGAAAHVEDKPNEVV